jgi:isoleucyl-tRNA synthetase
MDECQLHRATRALTTFILEDLSRWYVQLVRPRMWLEGESLQKRFAYETMYYTMRSLVQLLAPFAPHITEEMYQNLRLEGDPESVHMLSTKAADLSLIDPTLESAMSIVRAFDDAQANARQAGRRKLRWPIGQCVVVTGSPEIRKSLSMLNTICTERANAREVRVIAGAWDRIGWRAEPVMKALGPAFGRDAPRVRELILAADASRLKQSLDAGQPVTLQGTGNAYEILPGQVTFHEDLPGTIFSAPMEGATVYVDVELTPDLEAEGYARELIRRLQEMRRLLDLNVEDFILVDAAVADDRISDLVREQWITGISEEVRARELQLHGTAGLPGHAKDRELVKDWDIEGIAVTLAISRVPDQ